MEAGVDDDAVEIKASLGVGEASRRPPEVNSLTGTYGAVRPAILYLARREGLSPVFASQVVSRMAAVAEAGLPVDIGVFTPFGQWVRPDLRARWARILSSAPPVLHNRIYRLPSFPSRVDLPTVESGLLALWIRARYGRSSAPIVLQCRNATVTGMALKARGLFRRARVVFDCRGLQDHEFLYVRGETLQSAPPGVRAKADRLAREQSLAAHRADAVMCVSSSMVDYIVHAYGIPREKCVVMPCCTSTRHSDVAMARRGEVRRRLGFNGRLVVTYCGSLSRWQMPYESLALFRRIQSWYPDARFLGVTTQPGRMRAAAHKLGVPTSVMTVVDVPEADVATYLAAADIGLLLREHSVVNHVSFPVKFAEYLASGTPVILSEGIGDCSDLARRERVGFVLPNKLSSSGTDSLLHGFLDDYRVARHTWRARCRDTAVRHLDLGVYVPQLIRLYERLCE